MILNNEQYQLSSDSGRNHVRTRIIYLTWLVTVILVVMANLTLADDVAVEVSSPIWVADIESSDMGASLTLSADAYEILAKLHAVRLTQFPLSRDKSVDLELEHFSITTPTTRIVAGTDEGDIPIAPPDISLFRGRVADVKDSRVVLGISPRGCYGVIGIGQDGYVVTPLSLSERPATGASHVINKVSDLPEPTPDVMSKCGVQMHLPERPAPIGLSPSEAAAAQFRFCRLALECDYEYWDKFNDMDLALDYIYLLFGTMGDIYERDLSVKLALTFIRIWTTINDPYSYVGGENTGLHEFQNYWNANHSTQGQPGFVERDLAHILSSRPVGAWAYSGVLCNYSSGYSISGGNAGRATPAQSLIHDIAFAGHEIGHNFDGLHTHCFDPPIDKCETGEGGCWNGGKDCNTAPSTIMSYCDGCPGGLSNIMQQFHTANIARIRNHIDSSCLGLARNPCYVDWRNNGSENGTASNPYNTVKEGVEAVLPGGTVSIANGNYPEANWLNLVTKITIWQPMTLTATGGTATIGQ